MSLYLTTQGLWDGLQQEPLRRFTARTTEMVYSERMEELEESRQTKVLTEESYYCTSVSVSKLLG